MKNMISKSDYLDSVIGYEIPWWGVDKNGYIFHCLSAGCAHIPKVIIDMNEANSLAEDYFIDVLDLSTDENDFYYHLISEYEILLARKGIFCFEAVIDYRDSSGHKEFTEHPYWYKKIVSPVKPIHIDSLDKRVQILMSYFRFNVDVKNNDYIFFKSLWDVL